jgi:putative nucleotidyltransferase with HDIG domain
MASTETEQVVASQIGGKSCDRHAANGDTGAAKAPERATRRGPNTRARWYVRAVFATGCVVLALSVVNLSTTPPPIQWWLLVALTLVSGSAVLRMPSVPVSFSISDVFTLTSAVIFGPAAGAVMVAFDSLVISSCLARTGLAAERILFNAAAPPVAMWLSAHAFFAATGLDPLYGHSTGMEVIAPWLLFFAALYFCLNTLAIAVAIALHERANVIGIWRAHFQHLWFTFIGGAIGAAFVVFALQHGRYAIVVLAFPLLLVAILYFAYRNATGRMEDQLSYLAQVNRLNLSTVEALAHAIDAKDGVTHDHIRRVQRLAIELGARLGVDEAQQVRALEAAALLHDIGKLAIPEHILNKPGKLTTVEFERMKTHARIGAEILSEVDFPYPVVPIVQHHHENWDGTGYPDGLRGADIPIGARILAVVDCFDALTSDRPYRRALSSAEALEIIKSRSGTMYEPRIVEAFCQLEVSSSRLSASPALASPQRTDPQDPQVSENASSDPRDMQLAMTLGAALARRDQGTPAWRALVESLCELPDVDAAAVLIKDASDTLVADCASGIHADAIARLRMPVGGRMSGWAAAIQEPIIGSDAALDLFDVAAPALRSAVAIPDRSPDNQVIVVSLYSRRADAFTTTHRRLVEAALAMVSSPSVGARVIPITHKWPRAGTAISFDPPSTEVVAPLATRRLS